MHNATTSKLAQCRRSNPFTATTGETKDISGTSKFGFFQWVMYFNKTTPHPKARWQLGRALGPTKDVGDVMCQWTLQANGKVVSRRTARHLTDEEQVNSAFDHEKESMMN